MLAYGRMDETADETAGEAAYRRIRSDIVFGRLAPGRKLRLEWLRERYEASIATLRELLNRLASEGFIRAEGQRGFEVTPISAADLRDIAGMRVLLEGHAMELSFAAGDTEWEGRVVGAHHKLARMERRMLAGDRSEPETWKRYDREFHRALISACGSSALLDIHDGIYDRYLRYLMVAVVFRGEPAAQEHGALLEAALRRDATAARAILVTHVDACVDTTLRTGALP